MFQKMSCKAFTTTIIIGLIMSLTAILAGADTPVGGFISVDTTWTAADSPYEMIASVIVAEGVTLTIEPDVIVKVAGPYALQIKGGLVARGTETKPIIFTTTEVSPTPGSWGYIKFEDSSMDAVFDADGEYVSGSILQYCTVEYGGGSGNGAVWGDSASPFIDNSIIRQNAASGLYLDSSASIISNNTISDNSAVSYGGGISTSSGTVTISNNTISDNSAGGGGGIYTSSGTVTISNNTISDNNAEVGGGIHTFLHSTITISDNTISGNSAGIDGGGISTDGTGTISNNTISGNSAYNGGGISAFGTGTISDNTISGNSAYNGGGISAFGTVTISGNTISGNTISSSNGAAVYTESSEPFTDNVIANNESKGSGNTNAVFIDATPAFHNNSITDNSTEFALYYNKPVGSDDLDATNNWWGTTVDMEIFSMIYDFWDDPSKGIVNYAPYLLAPPGAPAAPEDLTITVADSTVTLNWTANTEPDLAGYKVYYGQSEGGPYDGTGAVEGDSPIDVGDVTTATLSGLSVDSATYYMVVTAYDTEDPPNESSFSNEVSNNTAPQAPTNQSPADGAVDVALIPTLEADAFFDADGDGHAASQWKVNLESGGTVYDSGEDTVNLTSITLPIALEPMKTYKWRVRYLDGRRRWSQYSETTTFTTVNPPTIVCKTDKLIYNPLESVQVLADVDNPGDSFSANLLGGIIVVRTPPKKPFILKGEVVTETINPGLNPDILLYSSPPIITAIAPKVTHGAFCVLYTEEDGILAIDTSIWGLTVPASVTQEKFFSNLIRGYIKRYGIENLQNANADELFAAPVSDVPSQNALSRAFPNTANPETWFPFQLSEPSEVKIDIYNASGQLVKTLALGYKDAGYYLNKEKAAFWDGKNERGERVASGIYFYTIQTRNFTATRKVAILK